MLYFSAIVVKAEETRRSSSNRDVSAVAVPTRAAILDQLDRIVRSPAFSKSQRYPAFLRYCVEAALDGRAHSLKERIIGIDVFGRPIGYDPSTDHVVRSAACEVRKRLAQYYQDSSAPGEIRVEIYPGSYVPRFSVAEERGPKAEVREPQATATKSGPGDLIRRRATLGAIPVSAAIFASILVSRRRTPGAFDSFWRPMMASEGQVIVCVGAGANTSEANNSPSGGVAGPAGRTARFSFAATMSVVKLSRLLEKRGVRYRVVPSSSVTFGDLQGAASILIGAYNNPWSLRSLESFRFRFGSPGQAQAVYDRKEPQGAGWAPVKDTRDYALIARVRDKKGGHAAVIFGGVDSAGTAAATEFLTDPAQLQKLQAVAPNGWQDMNLQVVLSTDLVNGVAGHPQIVATDFW